MTLLAGRHFMLKGSRELRAEDLTPEQVAIFHARRRREASGCLVWEGARNSDGYGLMRVGPRSANRKALVHRIAVALEDGVCPPMLVVDHERCTSRLCTDRAHLRVTTPEENTPGIYGLVDIAVDDGSEIPF